MASPDTDFTSRLDRLGLTGPPPKRFEALSGDASTRRYFRGFFPDGTTAIVMVYPQAGQNEEAIFLSVQQYLEGLHLPVPQVFAHEAAQSIVLLQDLGDEDLETFVKAANRDQLAAVYQQAVSILLTMVRKTTAAPDPTCPPFGLAFDMEKLMWEMDFFMTHFVEGLCGAEPSRTARDDLQKFFVKICGLLAAEPRVFCHRDYHARNLMVHRGRLVMIDFQDARMGPAQYDLASLLRDSYVTLPEDLVDAMLHHYYSERDRTCKSTSFDRFRYVFDVMSLQRNIKALGTFGYQSSVIGTDRYHSAIPRTGAYIAENLSRHPEFTDRKTAVEDHIVGPALALDGATSGCRSITNAGAPK